MGSRSVVVRLSLNGRWVVEGLVVVQSIFAETLKPRGRIAITTVILFAPGLSYIASYGCGCLENQSAREGTGPKVLIELRPKVRRVFRLKRGSCARHCGDTCHE